MVPTPAFFQYKERRAESQAFLQFIRQKIEADKAGGRSCKLTAISGNVTINIMTYGKYCTEMCKTEVFMEKKYIMHLVPSTHWDREWYLPFRRFQVRLVRLMDKVVKLLESGRHPYFLLDGQTIMLEDYLEAKPWMKERIHELIRAGKLIVGPWYVVPDMFIPSGESLWKNLEIGAAITAEYDGGGNVGYSPDSFGIAGQLPQMYAHFGKKYAMYTRGQRFEEETQDLLGAELFTAPDGTSLLTEHGTYNMGVELVLPTIWKHIDRHHMTREWAEQVMGGIIRKFDEDVFPYKNRMLICGIDHIEPRDNFDEVLGFLRDAYPEIEFKGSTQDIYFEELEKEIQGMVDHQILEVKGEQRGNYKEHFVLGNVMSSRMDIKMQNREAENLLFSYLSGLDMHEKPCDDFEFLDRDALLAIAQRELIKCHPHDSICTCSVDETNADTKSRLNGVKQIADEIIKDDMLKIGASLNGHGHNGAILVYNCLPYARTMQVEGKLSIPYKVEGNCISDGEKIVEGSEAKVLFYKRADLEDLKYVYFEELEKDTTRVTILDKDTGDQDMLTGVSYRFLAEDVPAMGFKLFYLAQKEAEPAAAETEAAGVSCCDGCAQTAVCGALPNAIENDILRLNVNPDGSVDILNKNTGYLLKNANRIEWCADEGDEYTYSNAQGLRTVAESAKVVDCQQNEQISSLQVQYEVTVPGKEDSGIQVISAFTLKKGSDIAEIQTQVCHETEGFRLRALFDAPGQTQKAYSDTAFDLTGRPVYHESELGPKNIMTMPCRNLVYVPAADYDLDIYSASAQEYETVNTDAGSTTALTLMRSVGNVYCMELLTRDETSMGHGCRWFTEDGKMKGKNTFRYAVRMADKGRNEAQICNDALSWQLPLLCWGVSPEGSRETADFGGFALEGAVLSRVDKKGENVKVRIFNPAEEEAKAVFAFADGQTLEIVLGKKKIANVDITEYLK